MSASFILTPINSRFSCTLKIQEIDVRDAQGKESSPSRVRPGGGMVGSSGPLGVSGTPEARADRDKRQVAIAAATKARLQLSREVEGSVMGKHDEKGRRWGVGTEGEQRHLDDLLWIRRHHGDM